MNTLRISTTFEMTNGRVLEVSTTGEYQSATWDDPAEFEIGDELTIMVEGNEVDEKNLPKGLAKIVEAMWYSIQQGEGFGYTSY